MAEQRRASKGCGKSWWPAGCWDCFPSCLFSPESVAAHAVPTFSLSPHPVLPWGCWSWELMHRVCRPCSSHLPGEQPL